MKAARGFSLAETLLVLAVAAVLAGFAVPNLMPLAERIAFHRAADELYGAIDFTRTAAIARGTHVVIAPDEPGQRDWTRGWVIFVDRDGDGVPGADDDILRRHGPLPPGVRAEAAFSQQGPAYLAYNGVGRSCTAASSVSPRWGSITLSGAREMRRIRIAMLGRARLCDPQHDASCGGTNDD